jgi:hypothetical protein
LERYRNLSGDSGVTHYEIGLDYIRVQFEDGSIYVYDYSRPGQHHVDEMKSLAVAGPGLSTYISQHVRKAYARKEP